MKTLFQSRHDLFSKKGGDTYQILTIKKYLEKLGVNVEINLNLNPDLKNYDLIHIFNTLYVYDTYEQIKNAKKQKKAVILTPIYHNINQYKAIPQYGFANIIPKIIPDVYTQQSFKNIIRSKGKISHYLPLAKHFFKGYKNQLKEIFALSDFILPNSYLELKQIEQDTGLAIKNFKIIPVGIENQAEDNKAETCKETLALRSNFILCVGRIEVGKNQLNLIKALSGIDIPLVFIGSVNPNHKHYYKECLKIANKNTYFVDALDKNKLQRIYKLAKVHVQPSWFETVGLTSLEAAINDCNIVVSDTGYTKEYTKNMAWYCAPYDLKSIKNAVLEAYNTPYTNVLKKYIIEYCNFERITNEIVNVYQSQH